MNFTFGSKFDRVKGVATIDGNYAFIIYAKYTDSTTELQNSLFPLEGLYAVFLEYKKGIEQDPVVQGPVVLYQTASPLDVFYLDCSIAYVRVGHSCIMNVIDNTSNSTY